MGLGVIAHIIEDMMTAGGHNLIQPFKLGPPPAIGAISVIIWIWKTNGYAAVAVLSIAGPIRERCLLVPISGYAISGRVWAITKMGSTELQTLATDIG